MANQQTFYEIFSLKPSLTFAILLIWDLIRSVNISGYVAPLLFVSLVSETARPVSTASQNIGFSLFTNFVRLKYFILEKENTICF